MYLDPGAEPFGPKIINFGGKDSFMREPRAGSSVRNRDICLGYQSQVSGRHDQRVTEGSCSTVCFTSSK
jgi:hypothetical protein